MRRGRRERTSRRRAYPSGSILLAVRENQSQHTRRMRRGGHVEAASAALDVLASRGVKMFVKDLSDSVIGRFSLSTGRHQHRSGRRTRSLFCLPATNDDEFNLDKMIVDVSFFSSSDMATLVSPRRDAVMAMALARRTKVRNGEHRNEL